MSLCNTIDTLSMAYLDDELAAEERHELEAHLTECASCRATLERERADRSMIRRALAAPAAPDLLRAKLSRAFDEVDKSEQKQLRRKWSSFLLPGSAMVAAAAAIAVFVGVQMPTSQPKVATVAQDAVKTTSRPLPLEVQGASTGPWLQQHFATDVAPPQIEDNTSKLLGARLMPNSINGHDAALLRYAVSLPGRAPFVLAVIAIHNLQTDELEGTPIRLNDRTLYVSESPKDQNGNSVPVVSYMAPNHVGFMFMAPELNAQELLGLVSRTNLIAPQ
jgi:anti-sigma factor RsiW